MPTVSTQTVPIRYRQRARYQRKFKFPLTDLCAELLEKIIEKMDPRSYYRLQRTCRSMNAFIRQNKHITVHTDDCYMVPYCESPGINEVIIGYSDKEVNPEALYGTRLRSLFVNRGNPFDAICDVLKKYRITSYEVSLGFYNLSKEQVQTFLEITQPIQIGCLPIPCTYELLLQSKILKNVQINLERDSVVDAMTKYLPKFSNMELHLVRETLVEWPLVQTVLMMLFSEYRPHLRYFEFYTEWADIPGLEVDELFHGLSLKSAKLQLYSDSRVEVEVPPYFPPEATCEITMGMGGRCKIVYRREPQ